MQHGRNVCVAFFFITPLHKICAAIVKQEIEDLKAAATNVERFVDISNKYTDLRELTPEVLRTFIERIIIHERTAKHSKTATQQIDIYFRYIGKLIPEEVA